MKFVNKDKKEEVNLSDIEKRVYKYLLDHPVFNSLNQKLQDNCDKYYEHLTKEQKLEQDTAIKYVKRFRNFWSKHYGLNNKYFPH